MPQILHPQQQDDLCAQTYPQKMGIDNSHAAVNDQRGEARVSDCFLVGSAAEVSAEEQCSVTGKKWEENAPIESDRYGGDLGRTLGFPVQAGPAHHPQRSVPF
jgi:hypothetical protein